jgi:hypothetical protein
MIPTLEQYVVGQVPQIVKEGLAGGQRSEIRVAIELNAGENFSRLLFANRFAVSKSQG